jgi:hypothetical protein
MQDDGNLALRSGYTLLWETKTRGSNLLLEVQDDGNLVIYNQSGQAMWSTGT